MKKILLLTIGLTIMASMGYSQKMKNANKYFSNGDYPKAISEVNGVLEKNPDDKMAIYLKSKLYAIAADSADLKGLVGDNPRAVAFDLFKKSVADSGDAKLRMEVIKDGYQPAFTMYAGYYQDAVNDFNKAAGTMQPEDFKAAMNNFIDADKVGHYINSNGWAEIGDIDTTLVLNIGKAGMNAKDDAVVKEYFSKLADAKISSASNTASEEFKLPYEWLESHYKDAGDEANMLKYADLGNELFPKETFFNFMLMDYYRAKGDMAKVIELYPHVVENNPDSVNYKFSYANDIFGYIYNNRDEDQPIENKTELLSTLKKQLDDALAIDPNHVNSNWLTAQYYYNLGIEQRDEGLKATDKDEKDKLKAEAVENWNKAVPFASKAIELLGNSGDKDNKSRYKSVVNLMQNIYQSMGDKDNLKKYQDLYDAADAKFGD